MSFWANTECLSVRYVTNPEPQTAIIRTNDIKGQGRKPLISDDYCDEIKKLIIENPKQIKKVISEIDEKLDIKVSPRTLKRFLKKTKIFMA